MQPAPSDSDLATRLAALSHPRRLALFQLLVRRYPDRLAAGDIGAVLGARPSTLSAWLTDLSEAGLIDHIRRGTSLLYGARLAGAAALAEGVLGATCRNRFVPDAPRRDPRVLNVLFVGTANAARTLMAEALLRDAAGTRFEVFSAGAAAVGRPDPQVMAMLAELGHDTGLLWSKPLTGFLGPGAPRMDLVLTLDDSVANQPLPDLPGRPVQGHAGLPDPVAAGTAEGFAAAYLTLRNRTARLAALRPGSPRDDLQATADALAGIGADTA